ncbi:hypothetical protein [Megalodesulfovibrio gigas]|uniref:Uncharacterized protein n=1 Tax=Megalodesulfovibrio gigas (strain ATCC 19364 / DSM 1382 / NCIMB 9332 / VKM B-1759) TaxID=1121448 RepID=T2GCH5_MEGG1|nr:hypothetical protein [Megalodesulfovibrio gigas]AGW14003.1 hypothetical protein DGI_2248 [Megalodesulfovibrio gigas DSM 1382 = ATCC 19364]
MLDYSSELTRLQHALARQMQARPQLLNLSPRSLAWKVDPWYYVALAPQFLAHWAVWGAMRPGVAAEVLLRTGVMVSRKLPSGRKTVLPVRLVWSGGISQARSLLVPVQLFQADAMDRALLLQGHKRPAISPMRVHPESRPMLAAFLRGKTMLSDAAFQ